MLTDSGTNAMSDHQLAAMMVADDSYAGSATFTRLEETCGKIFHKDHFIPAHQGRACEHLLAQLLVRPGQLVPMNYHFTTTKRTSCAWARSSGTPHEEADPESTCPFRGIWMWKPGGSRTRGENIASCAWRQDRTCRRAAFFAWLLEAVHLYGSGVLLVLDASSADNLYFIRCGKSVPRHVHRGDRENRVRDVITSRAKAAPEAVDLYQQTKVRQASRNAALLKGSNMTG